jgi:hypothetical protein
VPARAGVLRSVRPARALRTTFAALAAPAFVGLLAHGPISAQEEGPVWNHPATLGLLARARELRHSTAVDSVFRSYRADARGYVYFFFDRPETGERSLVKADQVALEIYWQAPNRTKQLIVGRRDQKVLPTDIRYHLDHLTVVQDDFGDLIRMGEGDEVAAVPHPVAPGAEAIYDYQLSDSLTLTYAGGDVRVYEVRVRPKSFSRPGVVGAVYLDRANAAIVRMSFSFTPASYVDEYVDYIRVSLDNSLWLGRFWLPYRQEVEIRREIPLLDTVTGSVIRARFEIGSYDFDASIPTTVFVGERVSSVSLDRLRAFPFERGLFDDLDDEGLAPTPSLEEVRAQVRQIVEDRTLSGLAPLRIHFANVSSLARYNRAEGLRLGGGASVRSGGGSTARAAGGYAIGRERLSGLLSVTRAFGSVQPTFELFLDELGDVGGHPGASTLENTISSASGKKDYTDPYFRRGAALTLRGEDARGPALTVRWEKHVGARDVVSDDPADTEFRPVRSIQEGALALLGIRLPLPRLAGIGTTLDAEMGRFEGRTFAALDAEAYWEVRRPGPGWHAEISLGGGALTDGAPPQAAYLLGGRRTLPGHDYRAYAGYRYWLLRGEVTLPLVPPYVGVRAIGAAGATALGGRTLPDDWAASDSNGPRASVGAGLSLGWDVFRVDLARGVRGGGWEALFSVARTFRSWL